MLILCEDTSDVDTGVCAGVGDGEGEPSLLKVAVRGEGEGELAGVPAL